MDKSKWEWEVYGPLWENWLPIKGYEGHYEVSDFGRIKSLKFGKERILKQNPDSAGYLIIGLHIDGNKSTKKVHQLVAIAFLEHEPCGMKIVVDHRDNIKINNRANNIQLISNRENSSKDRAGGTSKYIGVHWHKECNKWYARITINGKYKHLGLFFNELEAAKAYQNALTILV